MENLINKITLADCMDVMKDMPDKSIDLAIADPPYGIGIDDWDNDIPDENYFKELFRISKDQIIWGGNYFNLYHTEGWICWDKTFSDDIKGGKLTQGGCPRENMSDFELAWTSLKIKSKFIRYTYVGNLKGFNNKLNVDYKQQKKIHPTQKPVQLYQWTLQKYAKPGQLILDTHSGSGSLPCACHLEGFNFIATEKDKDYHRDSVKRFKEIASQGTLF